MKPKLIRDRIPEILVKKEKGHRIHTATETEYPVLLDEKLQDEVQEYLESKETEELADILEVIHAIATQKNISFAELEKLRVKKKDVRGAFAKRVVLDQLDE